MAYASETIALELVARLGQITTGNGYAFTASDVSRVNRDGDDWTPEHLGIVVKQGDETRNPAHDRPGNPPAMAYEQAYELIGFVRQSDRADTSDDSLVNQMEAAIKKAVAENSGTWHQFDGASYDANWGDTTRFESTAHAGLKVPLSVRYRVSELDPLTLRN